MKLSKNLFVGFMLVLLVLMVAAYSNRAACSNLPKYNISGVLVDDEGNPITAPNVKIVITGDTSMEVSVDEQGQWNASDVSGQVTVTAAGSNCFTSFTEEQVSEATEDIEIVGNLRELELKDSIEEDFAESGKTMMYTSNSPSETICLKDSGFSYGGYAILDEDKAYIFSKDGSIVFFGKSGVRYGNKQGSYIYTIFSDKESNIASKALQNMQTGNMDIDFWIPGAENHQNGSFRLLLRNRFNVWFLSSPIEVYAEEFFEEGFISGYGKKVVINDFDLGNLSWNKINLEAMEDMNQLDNDDGPGKITFDSTDNVDLSVVTGYGIYIEEALGKGAENKCLAMLRSITLKSGN